MRYLFQAIQTQLEHDYHNSIPTPPALPYKMTSPPSIVKMARGRCDGLPYLNFAPAAQWFPPNISLGEGPIKHHPYCTEAMSSNRRLQVECEEQVEVETATSTVGATMNTTTNTRTNTNTNTNTNNTNRLVIQLKLLTVEYALDVELPTLQTRTTHETIALYLEREKRTRQSLSRSSSHDTKENYNTNNNKNEDDDYDDDSVCIVNTGVHDPKLYPYMTPQLFAINVERYLRLIHPHCGTLIWLGIAAVSNRPRMRRQRNEILVLMDDEVNRWLDRYSSSRNTNSNQNQNRRPILRIDVWNKSLTCPHKDHVHLSPPHYYTPLASLIATFLRPPAPV
jgi:hypothetical protein